MARRRLLSRPLTMAGTESEMEAVSVTATSNARERENANATVATGVGEVETGSETALGGTLVRLNELLGLRIQLMSH